MRVLITGAGGFIGSHTTEAMVRAGNEVIAMTHYNGAGSDGWLDEIDSEVRKSFQTVPGDITDAEFVRNLATKVDVIVNLAALIAIPYSYAAPRSYVNTNVVGTLNICEAARSANSRLVQISTSEVYGTPDSVPIKESHQLKPQSPYAATKVAADQLALSYFRSFDLPVTVLRPFNTYGPRQSMRAVIPTILGQMFWKKEKIEIGDLSPKRDFTFVSDTADAIVKAATMNELSGEVIQLGTGKAISIGELIELCAQITDYKIEIEIDSQRIRPPKSEVQILLSDPTKAENLLKWKSLVSLENGLAETLNWMKSHPNKLQDPAKYWR
jgi:NAD dependent epimerase/dehydratase